MTKSVNRVWYKLRDIKEEIVFHRQTLIIFYSLYLNWVEYK